MTKLYHGTSAKNLRHILKQGLLPRGRRSGNWQHSVDSHPGAVYLTNAYSVYFAMGATPGRHAGLIVEVDTAKLNPFRMLPDEDFLGQAYYGKDKKLIERTASYRNELESYRVFYPASLRHLGNCCHIGAIARDAITRYAIVPNVNQWIAWVDPVINLQNFKIMGDFYKELSARIFGDTTGFVADDPKSRFFRFPPDKLFAGVEVVTL
jgi:hypothetical protein